MQPLRILLLFTGVVILCIGTMNVDASTERGGLGGVRRCSGGV